MRASTLGEELHERRLGEVLVALGVEHPHVAPCANALAELITRGLAEISRLAVRKGANPLTLSGLSGLGDLVLTCSSDLSRNRTVGRGLAAGKTAEQIQKELGQVAEGVRNTKSAHELARRLAVEMPITEMVYRVLYEGLSPREGVTSLMMREPKPER